ncbi:type I-E CRISPR-associated protein Cas5/CasD [Photobacterium sp. 2_MG-2023]|uniref:type I-E CRISPR-associated protein Cas5/CasD n=1 Tax=unclassified Photobacterium TaxID=2628852 RepID=UPI001C44B938|nr:MULTISPECIES: type I-E CRISPR-associated protein Cas5/CasD [unclassified Photobacterium]MBV7264277.1 type I-E CRISPR-associated protein Cas5/CasD [Photobacterium sp. WH24]MDO6581490.1 type I-E CRISPR-associated protein Cas5/CasD [Photobacterium sp. 2_MG-2023]
MKNYLVFRLYGPLASWGQAAVGGDRPTGIQPTRSAILGLLGAALGIRREDEAGLKALQYSVEVAVKQTTPSTLMRDYHTAQVPSQSNKVVHRSRKSELSEDKLNTVLSSRDYRCDGLWIVAVSLTDKASISLVQLQAALLKPVFTLCLGRKSCPPALPLMPKVIENRSLKDALDTSFPALTRSEKEDAFWLGHTGRVTYFWEGDKHAIEDKRVLTVHPWDEPVHRQRWQFRQRAMYQLSVSEVAGSELHGSEETGKEDGHVSV